MKLPTVAACSLVACAVLSAPAPAAVVTFFLTQDSAAGTWQLATCASRGDNAGIASYSVPLIGSITSLNHKSPRAGAAENADASLSGSVGFTLFRSPDGVTDAAKKIAGSQDNINPTPFLIYGFGQTAGNWASVPGSPTPLGSNEGNNWLAKPIIASGTMTPGTAVKLDRASVDFVASTFNAVGSLMVTPATIFNLFSDGDLCDCPEPSTACMSALILVSGVAARRRFPVRV